MAQGMASRERVERFASGSISLPIAAVAGAPAVVDVLFSRLSQSRPQASLPAEGQVDRSVAEPACRSQHHQSDCSRGMEVDRLVALIKDRRRIEGIHSIQGIIRSATWNLTMPSAGEDGHSALWG